MNFNVSAPFFTFWFSSVFLTFADRQEEVGVPRVKLELVDGVSMTDVVLQVKTRGQDRDKWNPATNQRFESFLRANAR